MTDFVLWKVPVGYTPIMVTPQQEALIGKMRDLTNTVLVNIDDVPTEVRTLALDALALFQESKA